MLYNVDNRITEWNNETEVIVMTGTMNTRKQVGAARKQSVTKLQNGEWKREFNELFVKCRNETDLEIKESLKSALKLKSMSWGINNFPELK